MAEGGKDLPVCGRKVLESGKVLIFEGKGEKYAKVSATMERFCDKYSKIDAVGRMATLNSVLYQVFQETMWFVGFYLLHKDDSELLIVGPYQGRVLACGEIKLGSGVCGVSAQTKKTVVVPDVSKFEGYIACDDETASEIVAPLFDSKGNLFGVLDIDSEHLASFDDTDKDWLEALLNLYITPFL